MALGDFSDRIGSFDAFGRFRVANPTSLFDSKQLVDEMPLFFVTDLVSSATSTYTANRTASVLSTTSTTGSRAIRQSKQYFNYQPGKGLLVDITFAMVGAEANVRRRVGYFDDDDGIYIEQNGTTLSAVCRGTVGGSLNTESADQVDWNLDTLDGKGPSEYTVDLTKTHILVIDLQWLGVGTVRLGLNIDGNTHYFHEFHHANSFDDVYMRAPNLPVRWEIENLGGAAGGEELLAICCSVMTEGSVDPLGITRTASRGITTTSIGQDLEPILSIRLKSTHNRSPTRVLRAAVMSTSNSNAQWQLILNPTITGGTAASWTSLPDSPIEYDIAQDGIASAGHVIDSGYLSNSLNQSVASIKSALAIASDYGGTSDILSLCVRTIGVSSDSFVGSLTWLEAL